MGLTWEIWPRNADLTRTLDPISRWSTLITAERCNAVSTAVITGPADALAPIAVPGMGVIIDRGPEQVIAGSVRTIKRSFDPNRNDGLAWLSLGISCDLAHLARRLAFPDPTHDITTTLAAVGADYDTRSGSREDLILAYVAANIGPSAIASRRLPGLTVPASLGRGGSTSLSARFDVLLTIVATLAEAAGLRVSVRHDESTGAPRRLLTIEECPDVSAEVRFGPAESAALGLVSLYEYSLEAPGSTRPIALGGGELEARVALLARSIAAEDLWSLVAETSVDQRQTSDPAELGDAVASALADDAGTSTVAFTVQDTAAVQYRSAYRVGWRVGVDLPGLPDAAADGRVRTVTTTVSATDDEQTERLDVVIGAADASTTQNRDARDIAQAMRRLAALERST